ncbi:MAG: hypothetical protein M0P31_04490 [Solirubrobacteraceae bacterium]|nr:hypothetical protein [Solirubrobacteraceae bacterium]
MSTPVRLAAFAAALVLLFGGGLLAGSLIDPERDDAPPATHVQDAAGTPDDRTER